MKCELFRKPTKLGLLAVSLSFSLFCLFESSLPLSSSLLLAKETYNDYRSDTVLPPPTAVSFAQPQITAIAGTSKKIFYSLEGQENTPLVNKAVRLWCSDTSVAAVFWAAYGEAYISGLQPGECTVFVQSQANQDLVDEAKLTITEPASSSQNGYSTPTLFLSTDEGLAYSSDIALRPRSNLKINLLTKTLGGQVFDMMPRFLANDPSITVDLYGNVNLSRGIVGKEIRIILEPTDLSPFAFDTLACNVKVLAPEDYGLFRVSQSFGLFFHYVLCFLSLGLLAGLLSSLWVNRIPTTVSIFIQVSFVLLTSLMLLVLHSVILQRPFPFVCWISSPVCSLTTSLIILICKIDRTSTKIESP